MLFGNRVRNIIAINTGEDSIAEKGVGG